MESIAAPLYVRYQKGMEYGEHVDDPVMGQDDLYRGDISLTIFFSPKEAYGGSELTIVEPAGERSIKLDAGCVVFYPSTSRHYVVSPTTELSRTDP
jgi:PKHD-type hydroxylase